MITYALHKDPNQPEQCPYLINSCCLCQKVLGPWLPTETEIISFVFSDSQNMIY